MIQIKSLHIYPVKGCQGISLNSAVLGNFGFEGDRKWAVVGEKDQKKRTQITTPKLAAIKTELSKNQLTLTVPGKSPITLNFSDINPFKIHPFGVDEGDKAAAIVSEFIGEPLRLVRNHKDHSKSANFAYVAPFLVISEASLNDLNSRLTTPIPMDRFRPNIVLTGCLPYSEDQFEKIFVKDITLSAEGFCSRCIYTTIDQLSGTKTGAEPLKTLASYRRNKGQVIFGHYFTHTGKGKLSVLDKIRI